jgi:UDP-N-acetylmuramoylalanine--D-glutamate ligase
VRKNFKNYKQIYISPGISLFQLKLNNNKELLKKITSQTNEFLKFFHKQVIGITGTKGKSTTASLIYKTLKDAKLLAKIIGNIGIPPFDAIDSNLYKNIYIFELSSHQLEFVNYSPHIAILLNLFQDHLLHHGSVQKYKSAKLNIKKFQTKTDIFLNKVIVPKWIENINTKLLGEHNKKNIAFAWEVYKKVLVKKASKNSFIKSVQNFSPLEHRLEFVKTVNNIDFYNDSISTIPEATINAINTLSQKYKNITVLIGGFDRKIDYKNLQIFLNKQKNLNIIAMPNAGYRIAKALKNTIKASSLKDAVQKAKLKTQKNGAVLLSPAASSFDFFKDYKDRGQKFKKYI